MLNIVLLCNHGASTAMLCEAIEKAASTKHIDCAANAYSFNYVDKVIDAADIILLGPQIKFKLKDFEKTYADKHVPFAVIDTLDYGRMNGDNILKVVLEITGYQNGGII